MKQLQSRVRRAFSPPQLAGRPMLENVVYPLYSTAGLSSGALPSEVNLFGYGRGGAVAGGGNWALGSATSWHTNMETPGALAQPKVFTIQGVRVFLSQLGSDTTDSATAGVCNPKLADAPQTAAGGVTINNLNDPLLAFWSGVLRLTVGPKTYTNHPLWMFPSNVGACGIGSQQLTDETPALHSLTHTAVHGAGQYFDFNTYPVVIAAQQSFGVNVAWSWATNPSLGVHRALTVFLDGIMSREVS